MKRKKNLVLVVSIIVFVCVLLLGINTAFSVSRIEASFALFSEDAKNDSRELQDTLEENYKGKLLFFINTEKVAAHFEGYPYLTVTEIKKKFPDKLILSVVEKKEQYAFELQEAEETTYYITDAEGGFLRNSTENVNNADGGENFVISGLKKGEDGKFSSDKNYEIVMKICETLDDRTNGIRTSFKSLRIETNPDSAKITVCTAEGVTIYIDNPDHLGEKKVNAALDMYLSLSDANKLYGRVIVTDDGNDENGVRCTYSPRV